VKNLPEEYGFSPVMIIANSLIPYLSNLYGGDAGQYLPLRFIGDVLIELQTRQIPAYCRFVDSRGKFKRKSFLIAGRLFHPLPPPL